MKSMCRSSLHRRLNEWEAAAKCRYDSGLRIRKPTLLPLKHMQNMSKKVASASVIGVSPFSQCWALTHGVTLAALRASGSLSASLVGARYLIHNFPALATYFGRTRPRVVLK